MMLAVLAWPASYLEPAVFLRLFSVGTIFSGGMWLLICALMGKTAALGGAYPSLMALWAGMLLLNPIGWKHVEALNVRVVVIMVGGVFAFAAVAGALVEDIIGFSASLAGMLGGGGYAALEVVTQRHHNRQRNNQ